MQYEIKESTKKGKLRWEGGVCKHSCPHVASGGNKESKGRNEKKRKKGRWGYIQGRKTTDTWNDK